MPERKTNNMTIYLRPIKLEDGANIVKWRNSPKVSSHCFDKKTLTLQDNEHFFNKYIRTGKYVQFIVERIEEQYGAASYPIATVYLKDIDMVNRRCELCIFTSDDEEWNTESQSVAIKELLEKAFTEYAVHKIYTYVFAANQDEVLLMSRSGFSEEALLRKEAIDNKNEYVDVYRMSIFKEDYDKKKLK